MTLRPDAPARSLIPPGLWDVDSDLSTVRFSLKHLLVATVHGQFGSVAGALRSDGRTVRAAGSVDVDSIDTGMAARDERLRGPDFFGAEQHPTISFHATGARRADGDTWIVPGELKICGRTNPLTFTATISHDDDGPVIDARATLSRREHGLDWAGLIQAGRAVVGDRVTIELHLALR